MIRCGLRGAFLSKSAEVDAGDNADYLHINRTYIRCHQQYFSLYHLLLKNSIESTIASSIGVNIIFIAFFIFWFE